MIDSNEKARIYLKGTASCFAAILIIWITAATVTQVEGTFSYTRFVAGCLGWLFAIAGTVLAFFALRASTSMPSAHLLSVAMFTLNLLGTILGTAFFIGALVILKQQNSLRQTIEEGQGKALTNAVSLAYAEFRSNQNFFPRALQMQPQVLHSSRICRLRP